MLYSRRRIRKVFYMIAFVDVLYVLSFFAVPSFSPYTSFAEPATDLETHISISPSNTAFIELLPETFNSSSQTINVSTNNYTGYTLLLNTNTDTTDLVNTENDTLIIPTITLNESAEPQTPETFTIGYGYSTDNTHYIPVPGFITDSGTQVAITDTINSTDHAGEGATELSFGAKIPANTIAGNYQNSFQVTTITNDVGYAIEYKSNAGDEVVANLPENTIGTYNGSGVSAQLSQLIPNRYPYTFLGWSEDEVLTQESILYQPGDSLLLEPTKNNSYTLYAHWEFRCHPDATTISHAQDTTIASDAICMQDMKLSVARSMVEEDQYTLYDVRDQKPYFVSMLKDGNVWMTQNLDLGDAEKSYTLTSTDTDLKDGQTFVLPSYTDPQTPSFDTDIYNREQRYVLTNPTVRDGGDLYFVAQNNSLTSILYDSLEACAAANNIDTCRHYHAGNYYNYHAISAGTVTDPLLLENSNIEANISTSLCPAGWHLPALINTAKSFRNLVSNGYNGVYGSSNSATAYTTTQPPLYLGKSGQMSSLWQKQNNPDNPYDYRVTPSNTNSAAYFPTDYPLSNVYSAYYASSSAAGGTTFGYNYESPIRCIARDNTTFNLTITYIFQNGETPNRIESLTYNSEHPNASHLISEEPTREGYTFLGWALEPNALEPNYKPGEILYYSTKEIPTTAQHLNLYAIWEASTNLLSTISTMQEMTPEICDGTTTPTSNYGAPSAKLTDVRDGKTYWVAKLADGNCWMTQNLALGDKDTSYTITPNDSDVASSFILPAENTIVDKNILSAPSYSLDNRSIVNYQLLEPSTCQETYDQATCEHYSIGSYYNYFATTAGSDGMNQATSSGLDSICPLGWKLPDRTGTTSYGGIIDKYNLASNPFTSLNSPIYFTLSGSSFNHITNRRAYARYQLKGSSSNYTAFELYLNENLISATNYISIKNVGKNIRCVARPNETYTLSFNNNGGTGSPTKLTSPSINTGHYVYTLPESIPTRTDYVFAGWNTKSDGTGTVAQPGEPFSVSGSTTLYATWNYTVKYDANGGIGAPEPENRAGGATSQFQVSTITPTHDSKTFLGWSTSQDGNSTTYLGGSTITVEAPETTLYAIWEDEPQGLATISTMQEMSGTICEATPIYYSKQLIDTRDGKNYWVTKLADGNCWMTQNLDLGSKNTDYTLTPENSDVTEVFVLPKEDLSKHFTSGNSDMANFRASNDEYITYNDPFSSTSTWSSLASCTEGTGLDEEICRHYHTGAYYNWYTATAGTGSSISPQSYIASSSICPAGWRLPLGGVTASSSVASEYSQLLFAEGLIDSPSTIVNQIKYLIEQGESRVNPLYYSTPGYFYPTTLFDGSIHDYRTGFGNASYAWSSTAYTITSAETTYYNNSNILYTAPRTSMGKYYGASIRCVARSNETYTLTYDGNGAEAESVPISQTSAVTDRGRYTFTINSSIPIRPEYTFAGWNTKADGSGDTYQPGEDYLTHGSTTLYATWVYNLSFDANGGENAPETSTKAGGTTYTFTISNSTPTKEGAYFWGWASDPTSKTSEYYPSSRLKVTSPTTTLYAIWNDNEIPLSTITYMQEINSNICRETPNGYSKQLIDARDGKDYWVTKLADGNCWMTQNLDLGDTKKDYLLTPENSDVKNNFLLTKKDYSENIDLNNTDTIRYNDGESFIATTITEQSYIISSHNTVEDCSTYTGLNEETCKHYHSGNQYNPFTATAGTITTSGHTNSEASSSICPKGWRLPTTYDPMRPNVKSFSNLLYIAQGITDDKAGSTLALMSPLYFTMVYSPNEMNNQTIGNTGMYITSTAASSSSINTLDIHSANVKADATNKSSFTYGMNIRCVARNTPIDYTITYNYQDGITEPETKTLSFDGETRSLMIDTKKPEREGYNFVGWGTEPNSTEPTYIPGDLFEDRYTNSNMPTEPQSLILYAIWEESTNLLSTISTMQEMTPEICNGTTTPTTNFSAPSAQLTDTRDGRKYWVSKLADGKCWMTENLDLGSQETAYTLTPEDSDLASNFELPIEPTTNFDSSNYNTVNFRKSDLYTVTSRNTVPDYVYNTKAECDAVYGENNTFCQHYHNGGYYNWYTATAGEGLQSTSTNYAKVNTSICPAGWRLPYGQTNSTTPSEFSTLLYTYNIIPSAYTGTDNAGFTTDGFNKVRINPLYFTRSGYYTGTTLTKPQTNSYYQTSIANNGQYFYSLYFISDSVKPNTKISKYNGFNTRCIARDTETYTLIYDVNGGSTSVIPPTQTDENNIGHTTMTISEATLIRPGYRFLGYSRHKYADTAEYLPGESYTWADKNLRLYAIWEEDFSCHPNATTIGNIESDEDIVDESKAICMQDMNTTVAQGMTENEQYRLIDIRDNTIYFVAKLKDGNVWMTQNLDLGNNTKSYTLTAADSDVKEDFTLPTTPSTAFSAANANTVNFRDPGDIFYISSGSTAADNMVNSIDACDALGDDLDRTNCYHYHAGNYYSWYTATAGEGTNQIPYSYEQTDSSICPAGWRLPIGLPTATFPSEYPALLYAHDVISSISSASGTSTVGYKSGGLIAARKDPLYFTRSGFYNNSSLSSSKTEGYYWTTSNSSATNALAFQFYASNLRTNYPLSKHRGHSIRCVAKSTPIDYTINYHLNDGTDTVDTETVSYQGKAHELMIKTETPQRDGYIFKGWATESNATEPTYFQAQPFERKTISNATTENQSLDLYAIWEESPTNLLATISTMQEMTPAICSGTTTPSSNYGAPSAKLTDTRDGKTYWVSKLADGKCWMTQNLDLGDKEKTYTLTPEDSDVATNFELLPEDSTIQFNNLNYDVVNFRDRGDEYIVPNDNTTANSDWFFYAKERCEDNYNADFCAHYHTGNYYNWHTATAGVGTYNYNGGVNYTSINSSICPIGWRLPEATTLTSTGSDFASLLSHDVTTTLIKKTSAATYKPNGFNTLRNNSLYIPRAGYYTGNTPTSRAIQGHFWTSTIVTPGNAYALYFTQASPTPNYSAAKYIGRNIRCVARTEETYTLSYNTNGGENAPSPQSTTATNIGHANFTLSSTVPTREGFTFVNWNTEPNGTGIAYQPGDTYSASGSTTLYATWNFTLNYNANGGTNTPTSSTTNDGMSHLFTISSIIPTKENSVFLGWAEDPSATTDLHYAGSVIKSTSPTLTLYAIWGSSIALDSITTMQEMTSDICANTPTGYSKQLEDIRDRSLDENNTPIVGTGTKYYVSKLADGKCWMTQNLDFAPNPERNYYGDDANPSHTPDTDIGYGTSDTANVWSPTTINTTDSLSTANANKYIYRDLGERFFVSSNSAATDTSYTTREACESANNPETCTHSHAGNHYNWYTAVAGSGVYGTGSGANYTSAKNSICPYGWRLPFGRTASSKISEFAELMLKYDIVSNVPLNNNALPLTLDGLNQLRSSPLYFPRAGYFYNTRAIDNPGTRASYWTSTNVSNANAYTFNVETAQFTPNGSYVKNQAFTIRCVAR